MPPSDALSLSEHSAGALRWRVEWRVQADCSLIAITIAAPAYIPDLMVAAAAERAELTGPATQAPRTAL